MKHYTILNPDKRRKLYAHKRFCSRCGKKYVATGKYSRVCDKCNLSGEHWKKKRREKDLNMLKKERKAKGDKH